MNDKQLIPKPVSGKKRLEELRKKRKRSSAAETISNQRSMILIHIVIECATGVILFTGLFYIFRFIMMKRLTIDPGHFKLVLGCLIIFAVGWLTYLVMQIQRNIVRFKKAGNNNLKST